MMERVTKLGFFRAAAEWNTRIVGAALKTEPELARLVDSRGRTALHACCATPPEAGRYESADAVKTATLLLGAGARINAVHSIRDGEEVYPARPLWYAVARGRHLRLAQYLLKRGAHPGGCLWAAAWDDDAEMARMLLRHGAPLEERLHDETPLIYAIRHQRWDVARLLVAAGADVNAADAKGELPLDIARRRRAGRENLELLIARGAQSAKDA
jgi:hypothetical protein